MEISINAKTGEATLSDEGISVLLSCNKMFELYDKYRKEFFYFNDIIDYITEYDMEVEKKEKILADEKFLVNVLDIYEELRTYQGKTYQEALESVRDLIENY